VALAGIPHIPLDAEFKEDILFCLASVESSENIWGLFFCQGMVAGGKSQELGSDITRALIEKTPKWMVDMDPKLRLHALPIYVSYRAFIPEFLDGMVRALADKDPEIRMLTLRNGRFFLSPRNLETLLPFQNDPFAGEEGMGGRMIYALRNMALAEIQRLTAKEFASEERSEIAQSTTIFWKDWTPFLQWWTSREKGWRRWLRT
jgi:hypothetical protein